ncbi:MAG: hypothetical protein AAGF12_15955 [Myxococcota bacterium]
MIACGAIFMAWLPRVAPATIAEQRARLPPPAECDDPVAGVWRSHQYDTTYRDWTIFTLTIQRVEGSDTQLSGLIHNHSWDAGPEQEEPGPCRPGLSEWEVSMDGHGTFDEDGQIFFGGQGAWRLDRIICNFGPGGYNLDNFSGRIDFDLQEFQSVNNDGGRAVNHPTVFRRVSCFQSPPAPHAIEEPPPFYPDMSRGCGC